MKELSAARGMTVTTQLVNTCLSGGWWTELITEVLAKVVEHELALRIRSCVPQTQTPD